MVINKLKLLDVSQYFLAQILKTYTYKKNFRIESRLPLSSTIPSLSKNSVKCNNNKKCKTHCTDWIWVGK